MRVRLFSPGARWVWRLNDARWLAVHRRRPAWEKIFAETLDMLSTRCEIVCREGWCWTLMDARLENVSPKKRELIAAALLKAARYN